MLRVLAALPGAAWLLCSVAMSGYVRAGDAMHVAATIPLGDVSGRIDHLAFDAAHHRLFIAELGNNTVGVVDVRAQLLLRRLSGFDEPQGIGYEASTDTVYVANGGDGSVRMFSGPDLAPAGTIPLGHDADNVRVDQNTHRVYVGYGSGALAIIDPSSRKHIGDIALKGHPESFQLDPAGDRIFVNVPDAGQIAVASRETKRQVAAWSTGNLAANFPLAIDSSAGRVIAVFRRPARLQAYDMATDRAVGGTDVCSDSDDVFMDSKRHRVYVVCGGGVVDVLDAASGTYARIGRVMTSGGSRTGLFVPELDRLFVAIRAANDQPAAIWILNPGDS